MNAEPALHPVDAAQARQLLALARQDAWQQGHAVGVYDGTRRAERAAGVLAGAALAVGLVAGAILAVLGAPLLQAVLQ